jgi:alanine dehydrogenase
MKIGVLRETKIPPDKRVALPPEQILKLLEEYPELEIIVQPSELRCFNDEEFSNQGIIVDDDLLSCDILIGVKEVDIDALVADKTYLFFAHVAKEQPYNRDLLRAILAKNIKLIDYEYLTDKSGIRLIAFGRWAGIVGAYNGLRGWGLRTTNYHIKPAHKCHDRKEMDDQLKLVKLNTERVLITGGGRVAMGAMETMNKLGIREVSPEEYLNKEFDEAVVCRIDPWHYVENIDGRKFDLHHFFDNPSEYRSTFEPYAEKTDLYVAAHFWDPDSPRMFELHDMNNPRFRISMIADISCDIDGSVPCTTRATTIADPFYGYLPEIGQETDPFDPPPPITMMTVDNLPGELPRDASTEFADVLVKEIIPRFIDADPDGVIERATIARDGRLTERYSYLDGYVRD